MAQRLGRVNRFGGRGDTLVHIIHPTTFDDKKIREQRQQKTLALLQELKGDGSPEALGKLDPTKRQEAFAPEPTILPVSDILFDAWALTSIEDDLPGRPEVGPYLHGLADDLPQTTIAWRAELDLLQNDSTPEAAFKAIFGKHGIRPHESLTVPSYKVKEFLVEVLKAKPALGETRVVLLLSRAVKCMTVEELIDESGILFAEPTLVFPSTFGGLDERGMLAVPKKGDTPIESLDIADASGYEPDRATASRQRVVIERVADGWQVKRLLSAAELPDEWKLDAASSTQLVRLLQRQSGMKVRLVRTLAVDDEDDAKEALVCLSPAPQAAVSNEQTLEEHVAAVEKDAARLASLLFAEQPGLAAAVRFAAKWHDEGKKAKRWQKYIGGKPAGPYIGKAGEWRDPKILSGYRHEFGSLLRIPNEDAAQLGDMLDLALHLIATHHGSGRPHFAEPWDDDHPPDKCERIHEEVIRRFGRLQRQYGRWGLAYLESLLRAADIAASRAIGIDPEVDTDDTEGGAE
jgi:CRISPR-associated endonuclease/helicase Cas3